MNKTQNLFFKKALNVFMAVMMVFTMMPSMAWAEGMDGFDETTQTVLAQENDVYQIGAAEELAWFAAAVNNGTEETNEIDLSSSTKNGFVSDISFAYNVNSAGHGDEIILLDSSQILTAKVSLTSQRILDEGALYISVYVDGKLVNIGRKEQAQIKKAATTAYGLNHRDYPAGEVKNLSIVVGRIDDKTKNYTI